MLRTALLSLILFVSLSSSSLLRKSIVRRQSDAQACQVIEGFDCKCLQSRVTCTTDRDLPSTINIVEDQKHKYESVELVIQAKSDINVNEHTFEPVKHLYKDDGHNYDFRIKFEDFTALHLTSPGIFNRVFPDNLPSHARKNLAFEIRNYEVQPHDNVNLFQNLNVDSLEIYALYPFRGTFQQLFDRANIKYVRLSGDIRSDLSQAFTGNIGRLELAKQAEKLTVESFPAYPAHELVINAFYISKYDTGNPPNYDNLVELRVHSPERIPANAFQQFPNLRNLQLTTEKDIDPQALNGLNQLEKLSIKDTQASLDLLNTAPTLKEYEASIEKLDEKTQCKLAEKLANGQLAVQAVPNGHECSCMKAYLETAAGRYPCEAKDCEHSSCAAIKNNYDTSTRTFKEPPAIRRADGTDALRPREPKVYSSPYQVAHHDQEKYQQGLPPPPAPQTDYERPEGGREDTEISPDENENENVYPDNEKTEPDDHESGSQGEPVEGGEPRTDGEGNQTGGENQPEGQRGTGEGSETVTPPKRGMSWLPIIIIAASIVGLLIIGLIILFIRKRSAANKGQYGQAPTQEQAARA